MRMILVAALVAAAPALAAPTNRFTVVTASARDEAAGRYLAQGGQDAAILRALLAARPVTLLLDTHTGRTWILDAPLSAPTWRPIAKQAPGPGGPDACAPPISAPTKPAATVPGQLPARQ